MNRCHLPLSSPPQTIDFLTPPMLSSASFLFLGIRQQLHVPAAEIERVCRHYDTSVVPFFRRPSRYYGAGPAQTLGFM